MAAPPDELLDMPALQRRLKLSRSYLYELIRSGELPTVKIGKRRLARTGAIDAWLAAKERGGDRPSSSASAASPERGRATGGWLQRCGIPADHHRQASPRPGARATRGWLQMSMAPRPERPAGARARTARS